MKTWGCMGLRFIRFPLMKASSVRRGSHDPAGMPDRRSPALIIGPGFKGICALRAHSEGRRPSVGHSGGVRRPAPSKGFLEAQQELKLAKDSQQPVKTYFSSAQRRPPGADPTHPKLLPTYEPCQE